MALSVDTRVLTPNGYINVTSIKAGMKVVTPLGETTVLSVGDPAERLSLAVVLGSIRSLALQRFLLPDGSWGVVRNPHCIDLLLKTGIMQMEGNLWLEAPLPDEVFSFKTDSVPLIHELPHDGLGFELCTRIETENRIVVIDDLVTEGYRLPQWRGQPDSILDRPLPIITKKQLEKFKREYF